MKSNVKRIFRDAVSTAPKIMYVDKVVMLNLIKDYQNEINAAKETNQPEPIMSNELGKIILDMATNMSRRYNFRNYSFTDQFVSDSIILGLHLAKTFDAAHPSANPFSYFSLGFFRVNVAVIIKEKKLLDGKYRYIASLDLDTAVYQEHDNADDKHNNQYIEYLKDSIDVVRTWEAKQKEIALEDTESENEEDSPEASVIAISKSLKPPKYVSLEF